MDFFFGFFVLLLAPDFYLPLRNMGTQIKGIASPVAGQADTLIVPDLEVGTMLVKQLEALADGQSADIVPGARVPIALADRADTPLTRLVARAAALLLARRKIVGV